MTRARRETARRMNPASEYRVHARTPGSVITFVTRILAPRLRVFPLAVYMGMTIGIAAIAASAGPANPDLDALLDRIQSRYNHAQTLKLDFSEAYASPGRPAQNESGTLYLRKPGKMRWDYSSPEGKLFLSDGKDVYLYVPGSHRAEKSKLKQSEDMRAPLAFLLGKLDFQKEFKSFSSRPEGADMWIEAYPKSQNLMYTKVEFLASPDGEIHKVMVTGQDHSRLDYTFSNQQFNAPAPPSLFVFHPPPGVEVVATGQ